MRNHHFLKGSVEVTLKIENYGDDGRPYLKYQFFHNKKLIFEGNDFSPSYKNWGNPEGRNSAKEVIFWVTATPEDGCSEEFFRDYTKEQWEFLSRNPYIRYEIPGVI